MDRRSFAVVSLGLLLVVAGCSGLPGGGDRTASPGDGGTPTAALTYPDGYGESGVTDSEAAARAHANGILARDSFTIDYHATVEFPERTTEVNFTEQVDASQRRAYLASSISGGTSVAQYHTNDTVYVRSESPHTNETSYSTRETRLNLSSVTGERFVRPVVTNVTYGAAQRVEYEGEPMLRYESTDLGNASFLFGEQVSLENVTSFGATLVVDGDGIVRHVDWQATVRRNGADRSVHVTIDVSNLDATAVDRPDWVDKASR